MNFDYGANDLLPLSNLARKFLYDELSSNWPRERRFNILIVVVHIDFPLFACVALASRLSLSVEWGPSIFKD